MFSKVISKGALAVSLVGLVFATTRCDEPLAKCAAGHATFIGVYTLTSGDPTACNKRDGKGEQYNIQTYNAIDTADLNKPNLDEASIAIESADLGNTFFTAQTEGAVDPDATHTPYSLGNFGSAEPVNDFCNVPSLTTTIQNIPGYPADPDNDITDPVDPTSISYQWSNVRFYVTAKYLGNQFEADLVKTVDNVACGYHVIGMAPATDCSVPDPADPDNNPPIAEPRLCSSKPIDGFNTPGTDSAFTGSFINPDFPTVCDPTLLTCILTGSDAAGAHIPILQNQ